MQRHSSQFPYKNAVQEGLSATEIMHHYLIRSSTKSILVPNKCISAGESIRTWTPFCSTSSSNLPFSSAVNTSCVVGAANYCCTFQMSSRTCIIQCVSQTIAATPLDAQLQVLLQQHRSLSYLSCCIPSSISAAGTDVTLWRLASSCLILSVAASVRVTGDLSKRNREPPRLPSFDANTASEACTMSRQEQVHNVHRERWCRLFVRQQPLSHSDKVRQKCHHQTFQFFTWRPVT